MHDFGHKSGAKCPDVSTWECLLASEVYHRQTDEANEFTFALPISIQAPLSFLTHRKQEPPARDATNLSFVHPEACFEWTAYRDVIFDVLRRLYEESKWSVLSWGYLQPLARLLHTLCKLAPTYLKNRTFVRHDLSLSSEEKERNISVSV